MSDEAKQITVSFAPEIEPLFSRYCAIFKLSRTAALVQLATEALLARDVLSLKIPPLKEEGDREQTSNAE